jgi:hypothetical protein
MRCTPHTRTWPPMRTTYAQQPLMLAMCWFAEGRGASAWSTNTRAITKQNSPAHIRKRYRCAAETPAPPCGADRGVTAMLGGAHRATAGCMSPLPKAALTASASAQSQAVKPCSVAGPLPGAAAAQPRACTAQTALQAATPRSFSDAMQWLVGCAAMHPDASDEFAKLRCMPQARTVDAGTGRWGLPRQGSVDFLER